MNPSRSIECRFCRLSRCRCTLNQRNGAKSWYMNPLSLNLSVESLLPWQFYEVCSFHQLDRRFVNFSICLLSCPSTTSDHLSSLDLVWPKMTNMFDQVIPLLASEQTKTAVIGHISQGKMGFHDVSYYPIFLPNIYVPLITLTSHALIKSPDIHFGNHLRHPEIQGWV